MSKRFLISVAAIALMAGAGAVNAQGTKSESGGAAGGGAAMHQSSPSAGGSSASESKGSGSEMNKSSQNEKSGAMKNQRAEEKSGKSPQTTGQAGGHENNMKAEGRESNKAAESKSEKGNKAAESKSEKKSQTTGQASGHENNMKSEGREGRENGMKSEGRENNMKSEGNDKNMGGKAAEGSKSTTTGQAGANAKLSTEQRTKITSVIRNEHVKSVDHVNFSVSVGTRVPREGVTFTTLPTEVVTIYPEWRGYKYIVVHDEIVIIDPNSYEIVEVING
jgi:hypothetical protein